MRNLIEFYEFWMNAHDERIIKALDMSLLCKATCFSDKAHQKLSKDQQKLTFEKLGRIDDGTT